MPSLTAEQVASMLNRADLILVHGNDLPGRVIRLVTHSYWNHVAVVALLSDAATGESHGYQRTFILEAEADRGVDIHPIDKYLYNGLDLAILRFPAAALPAEPHGTDFLRRVRGFALEEIDATYGYGTILTILAQAMGPLGWVLRPIIRAVRVATSFNRKKAINDFICSGVIQYAYYRSCFGAGGFWHPFFQEAKNRGNIIVNPDIQAAIDLNAAPEMVRDQLKLTVPADFSRAAAAGRLQCVAQRIRGEWKTDLTEF